MPLFFMDYWYFVLVIPALIISMIASANVRLTFNKYNKKHVSSRVDSNYVVERILHENNINDVQIGTIKGNLTDHYNPSSKIINLSQSTAGKDTIAAIGVAAHEAGHAVQYKDGYFPVKLRSVMVPVVNFGSHFGIILAMVGMLFNTGTGDLLIQLGVALYSLVFIFTLVTLPVEFNASRRAVSILNNMGTFSKEELSGVKKVLTAAALTYVASMIAALANLLRLIILVSGRRNNGKR